MSDEENPHGFVRSKLPWVLGVGAFLLFLATLNHWVNLRSLPTAARVAGWEGSLPTQQPLLHLVTYPVRFFPAALQPLVLNVFTALCAALSVLLLARSVALLPHDRTHEQRLRERSDFSLLTIRFAWVPVVLACAACALQLTFWENATSATGEILDLLVFAYVIRCLLEFRISQNEGWLSKLALVYGVGITNNWALIGFFPFLLGSVIWIKGVRFFDPGFLMRMAVFGLAGLSLYLLLPTVWAVKGVEQVSFWEVLRQNWASQKMYLANTPNLRNRAFLLGLTSVLPVVLMGIRWPSSFGDTSVAGASLTNLAFRIIHLFFLGACLFIVFDPKYSPRQLGMGLSFLTFYYLGALAIGYYSGYALLVFTDPPRKSWRQDSSLPKLLNPIVQFAVLVALIAVPSALAYKNFGPIRADNGTILKEFVSRTIEALPKEPAYLLGEDAYQLALLQAGLGSSGQADKYVLVNTRSLELPAYHERLQKEHGARWPIIAPKEELGATIPQADVQRFVAGLASSNVVVYLQPSFGYFFERVYPEPMGQVYRLRPFAADQILPPALTPEQLQHNEVFWSKAADYVKNLEKEIQYESLDARYIAQYYSRALNTWGVYQQRAEDFKRAGGNFAEAFALNTNNIPAKFNGSFNKAAQSGDFSGGNTGKTIEEKFGIYRSWDTMLSDNGPFDHPEFCALLGEGLLSQFQQRQAALQFSRVIRFQPTNFFARISYAKALVYGKWIDKGMAEMDQIQRDFGSMPLTNQLELVSLRAAAYFTANDFPKAEATIQEARAAHPDEAAMSQALYELYRAAGPSKYTNALGVIDSQLEKNPTNSVLLLQKAELQINNDDTKNAHATLDQVLAVSPKSVSAFLFHAFAFIQEKNFDEAQAYVEKALRDDPENTQALIYRGIIHMEQKQYDKARESFNQVLSRQPENLVALRNRAILNLRAQRWLEAKDDYEHLLKLTPRSHAVAYGLGEIAYNQKDYREAARQYENYLKYAPSVSSPELDEEKKKVQERLTSIKSTPK